MLETELLLIDELMELDDDDESEPELLEDDIDDELPGIGVVTHLPSRSCFWNSACWFANALCVARCAAERLSLRCVRCHSRSFLIQLRT